MEYKWEIFEEGPVVQSTEQIYVTINRRGQLYLNRGSLAALDEPDAVVMMYDRRQQVIGLQRSSIERRSAFKLRRKDRDSKGRVLYASNFCRRHHIRPGETLRFTKAAVDKNGVLILSMHEVISAKR
jgi:hypothetical protein